jgi:serine/threonine protein phosphatase PrpC
MQKLETQLAVEIGGTLRGVFRGEKGGYFRWQGGKKRYLTQDQQMKIQQVPMAAQVAQELHSKIPMTLATTTKKQVVQVVNNNPPLYAVYDTMGARPTMEDRHAYHQSESSGWHLFMVCDGHGGRHASNCVADYLSMRILSQLRQSEADDTIPKMLVHTFQDFDFELSKQPLQHIVGRSGSTCTMLLWHAAKQRLFLVNTGDSRTIVFNSSASLILETRDHKPEEKSEKNRILERGGTVEMDDTVCRVNGILATSRAFGDFGRCEDGSCLKKFNSQGHSTGPVVATPDVHMLERAPGEKLWVVLACDGLWDVLSSREVARQVVGFAGDFVVLPKYLTRKALKRGSTDNVTVMLVQLL